MMGYNAIAMERYLAIYEKTNDAEICTMQTHLLLTGSNNM